MQKRKYTKKSPYWKQFQQEVQGSAEKLNFKVPDLDYEHIALGSSSSTVVPTSRSSRSTKGQIIKTEEKYELLSKELLPYEKKGGHITASLAIELCQKAAAGVPIIRNTVEIMTEFSTTKLHVHSKNKKAQIFIQAWLEKINIRKIQEQFFREYYRSGNVFFYRFDGVFDKQDQESVKNMFGERLDEIPLRYMILNAVEVGVESTLAHMDGSYVKILTPSEVLSLKNPKTKLDRDIFNGLDPDVKNQIKTKATGSIAIKLDANRLRYVFYKKQDYEPLAIPMLYPVLKDVEHKLQLKRVDRILVKTVDNIILLITMGAEPSKGGINKENINRIQTLLQDPAFGRTLVSDYTTEAAFIIPDLEKVLGPEKYEQVDKDIKEGLQNATLGENRFADTFVKIKVFIERLKDGQDVFITEFLMPEIKNICDKMNFRDCPEIQFEKISLHDPNVFNKTVVRMMELGVLVPDEAFKVMESGLFPRKESSIKNQEEFKKLKDKGYFVPLMSKNQNEAGRPDNTKGSPRDSNTPSIQEGSVKYDNFANVFKETNSLIRKAGELLKEHGNKKRLTASLKNLADSIACDVIVNSEMSEWEDSLEENILGQKPSLLSETSSKIEDIAQERDISLYGAAIIYHSQQE